MMELADHLLTAIQPKADVAGTYDFTGWDIRFTSAEGLGGDSVTTAHEQMHSILTAYTAWGSILKAAVEEYAMYPGDGIARRLTHFTTACRTTQEVLATYVSLAQRLPSSLATYAPGALDFAYSPYLDLAVRAYRPYPRSAPRSLPPCALSPCNLRRARRRWNREQAFPSARCDTVTAPTRA